MTVGVLTDKGMALDTGKMIARINDKPYEVPAYVLPYLAPIEKGTQVEYSESNEVITKIAPVKKPVPAEKPEPTPVKPEIKNYEGRVLSINWATKAIAFDEGPMLSFTQEQEAAVDQFKPRYKVKVEHDGEHLLSIKSNYVPSNGNGKSSYQRNEKLIAFLALHRDAVQGATFCHTPDTGDFNKFMDAVYDRARADLEDAIKEFGGA